MAESRRVQFFFFCVPLLYYFMQHQYQYLLCRGVFFSVCNFFVVAYIFATFRLVQMIQQQPKHTYLHFIGKVHFEHKQSATYNRNKMHLMVVWLNAITSPDTSGANSSNNNKRKIFTVFVLHNIFGHHQCCGSWNVCVLWYG